MADAKTRLDTDLAALFAAEHVSAGAGAHEEPAALLDYLEGRLGEDEGRRVRDHLEVCRECSEALLGLETLARPDDGGGAEFELAAAWRAFRERTAPPAARQPGRRGRPQTALRAAAAAFFAATVVLTWQLVRLSGELPGRAAPQVNVPVLYLEPTRAEGGFDARLEPGRGAEVFVIFLLLSEPGAFAEYEVEVLGAGEEPLWTGEGLAPSRGSGSLRIALSRGFLAPGEYGIRLYGVTAAGREPIDDYRIEIQ